MQIYLPIAEMPVNALLILAMGAAVGFLSGMFGVGGGFLMTPFLIFAGIPADVAVATELTHIIASSVSGSIAHWRRRTVDFKMGAVLITGGIVGSGTGVVIFSLLREAGQIDLLVSLTYVIMLGTVGGLMLWESVSVLRAQARGAPLSLERGRAQHLWLHGLPFKMRFRQSKLYMSVIPPLTIGFVVGVLAAIMGIGGGFIMVPAMIYILRMPTSVVVGTSLFQILFTTSFTTMLHAINTQTVDAMLALLLILGGVIGVQFGVQVGGRLRGEQLRALLALLVLGVAVRLALDLVIPPGEPFSVEVKMGT
ncbi:MAG: TSUP family transporter [Alphaproteobacteria bacterium]|nr:TSUP family transporter [Alphaproteobacteria bacterium]